MKGTYVQLTVKFPTGRERYRQAVECVSGRDRGIYPTQADYLTAAILAFEGSMLDERTSLAQIMEELKGRGRKADEILEAQKKIIQC